MPKFLHEVTVHASFVTEAETAEEAALDIYHNWSHADILDAIDNAPSRYGWGEVEEQDEFPREI